ncbi:MAG: hypothetical protein FWD00_01605 [Clostridiales bacterium]|nr:hypothetical protein [Clostridiales bacterium]
MIALQNKMTWLCYGISLIVFIVVFAIGRDIVTIYPSGYVTLSFYITTVTAFVSALTLGIMGNFLKWLYPIMVVVFAFLFSMAVIYSDQVYLYLHHNHGVNYMHAAINWTFFYLLTAITFLGLMIGMGIKLIVGKANTIK